MHSKSKASLSLAASVAILLSLFSEQAQAQKPVISTQPKSQNIAAGLNATFQAVASGSLLRYQWQFGGADIAGASGSGGSPVLTLLTLTNIQPNAAGAYQVVFTNNSGSVTSSAAVLVVGTLAVWGGGFFGPTNVALDLVNPVAIAAGAGHCLALRSDGTAAAWGPNTYGQTNVPAWLSDVVALAGGNKHSLALSQDGSVVAWGDNTYGQTNVPANLTGSVAIAAGGDVSLAISSNGTMTAWGGSRTSASTNIPSGLRAVAAVLGQSHGVALNSSGGVVAWGDNIRGQTKLPAGLANVVALSAGDDHTLALKADGTVVAWGDNNYGQTNVPPAATNVVAIAASGSFSLAAKTDGSVLAWGANFNQQRSIPPGLTNVISLASGNAFGMALRNFGEPCISANPFSRTVWEGDELSLYCMAAGSGPLNYQWQFNGGDIEGATNSSLSLPNAKAGNAGAYTVVVSNSLGSVTSKVASVTIRPQSTIAAWGANGSGENVVPGGLRNLVAIAGGANHSLALMDDGTLLGWGEYGGYQSLLPPALTNVAAIACGDSFNVALKADGKVACWGNPMSPSFTNLTTFNNFSHVAIAAGAYHILAVRADGIVDAIADSKTIPPGNYHIPPAGLSKVVSVSGGFGHSLALKKDGTVVAWGNNYFGQTSVPAALSNVVAIASGYYHDLALKADGTVVAWGDNSRGQTNVPPDLTNVVAISSSGDHNLALRADGAVIAWGWDGYGQSTVPTGLTNVTRISAGLNHSLALVEQAPPSVTLHPRGLTSLPGASAGFQVTAVGKQPLAYQWFREGIRIEGATDRQLLLSGLTPADEASYAIVVTNEFGNTTSHEAQLTLGNVQSWGLNTAEQTFVPAGLTNVVSVACGAGHNLALNSDGTVVGWGDPLSACPPLTNVAAVAAGYGFSLTLGRDGLVSVWGTKAFGVTNVPAGLANVRAVAAGVNFGLALGRDGRVTAWGSPSLNYGQTDVPADLKKVVAIAAGNYHALALQEDGSVVAWGQQTNVPAELTNVVAIAAGWNHSLALKGDGTLIAWGDATFGLNTVPAELTNVVAIAAGFYHNMALTSAGVPVLWGDNRWGQSSLPPIAENLNALAGGYGHTVALTGDGRPWLTVQPFDRSAQAGGSASFTTMATGSQSMTYQWLFNGVDILNATNSTLVLANLAAGNAGAYQCRVSNPLGTITTSPATLTVLSSALQFDTSAFQVTKAAVNVRLTGLVGSGPLVLYTSTNLVDWQALVTNPPVSGSWEYLDTATNADVKFYRASEAR